jgi:hypothetical protein
MDHRQQGVDLFNATWDLIDSRADDDLMLHTAHASAYHWSQVPEVGAENRARAHWLVSRVSALAGLPDAARRHAEACLRWCDEHDLQDWDRAFAYEALARAAQVAGDHGAVDWHIGQARSVPIEDDEDRELLERDLATIR